MTTTAPVLRLRGTIRIHGEGAHAVTALGGVDLDVHAGELVAITGRSGSGKSTLLNLAGGLDVPTSGTVEVVGQQLAGLRAAELAELRRRHVGYVFQDGNLLPTLTVAENVALPMELDGVGAAEARVAAMTALEHVLDAEAVADRFPDELSGGEQQRVAIARALIGGRELLLADEPTGALDELTAQEVMAVIRARVDAGAAAVIVTHDPAQAAFADRVLRLRDGLLTGAGVRAADATSAQGRA